MQKLGLIEQHTKTSFSGIFLRSCSRSIQIPNSNKIFNPRHNTKPKEYLKSSPNTQQIYQTSQQTKQHPKPHLISPKITLQTKKARTTRRNELNYLTINFIFTYMHSLFILICTFYFVFISLRTSESCRRQRRMNIFFYISSRRAVYEVRVKMKTQRLKGKGRRRNGKQSEILHT